MGLDHDYAFSDADQNDGAPDFPAIDDIFEGDWIEGKSPSSAVLRRYLFEMARYIRTRDYPEASNATMWKDFREDVLPVLLKLDASMAKLHKRMLADWALWSARSEGGIQ